MFTGIIEELGTVNSIDNTKFGKKISIESSNIYNNIDIGGSLSVNGVCLTLVKKIDYNFYFDIVHETLDKTNLADLLPSMKVNLETPIKLNESLGGHIVQGHIDTSGLVINNEHIGENLILEIGLEKKWLKYCIEKGSIAIDGISLTIADLNESYSNSFGTITVSIIPHTFKNTNLQFKKQNDSVNIETDFFGKYIEKLLPLKGN